jgi:hypothetical protein
VSTERRQAESKRWPKRPRAPRPRAAASEPRAGTVEPGHESLVRGLPDHPTSRVLRQAQALQLQRRHGNQVAQRLLGGIWSRRLPGGWIQREDDGGVAAGAGARSTEVPALSQTAVTTARANLSGDPQAAIDAVVADLVAQGQVDVSFLEGGQMRFSSRAHLAPGHYGHTSLTPGTQRPRPCRVVIGQDAMRNVGILYTTIMHEWQHVIQFRTGPATGRGEAVDETEARLWEVENLEQSGLWRDTAFMSVLPGQLNHWWGRLTPEQQQPLATRYRTAHYA